MAVMVEHANESWNGPLFFFAQPTYLMLGWRAKCNDQTYSIFNDTNVANVNLVRTMEQTYSIFNVTNVANVNLVRTMEWHPTVARVHFHGIKGIPSGSTTSGCVRP
jgi:hypothetical protein